MYFFFLISKAAEDMGKALDCCSRQKSGEGTDLQAGRAVAVQLLVCLTASPTPAPHQPNSLLFSTEGVGVNDTGCITSESWGGGESVRLEQSARCFSSKSCLHPLGHEIHHGLCGRKLLIWPVEKPSLDYMQTFPTRKPLLQQQRVFSEEFSSPKPQRN